MYLLDTDVISELRKLGDGRADPVVTAWAKSADPTTLYLSVVTVMELELGVRRLERRDPAQALRLREWLHRHVLVEFEARTLAIDVPVAMRCAALHVPDPRPERDALIAATALVHGFSLVTRNEQDFAPTGVPLINPWRPLLTS